MTDKEQPKEASVDPLRSETTEYPIRLVIKPRKCLRCLKAFPSRGAGNRLCSDCQHYGGVSTAYWHD